MDAVARFRARSPAFFGLVAGFATGCLVTLLLAAL